MAARTAALAEAATRQTQRALHETHGLFQAAQAILGATDVKAICQNLIRHFCALVHADRMALFLVDHERRQLELRVGQGNVGDDLDLTYRDLQVGISGLVFQAKQPVLSRPKNRAIIRIPPPVLRENPSRFSDGTPFV